MSNRKEFLNAFITLCEKEGLTYSEARFRPFEFNGRVELEFYVSGYRLWIHRFNEYCAEILVEGIIRFRDEHLPEEDDLDVLAPAMHSKTSHYSPYYLNQLPFQREHELWERFYAENKEESKPFYLEQDLNVLTLEKLSEEAMNYEILLQVMNAGKGGEREGVELNKDEYIEPLYNRPDAGIIENNLLINSDLSGGINDSPEVSEDTINQLDEEVKAVSPQYIINIMETKRRKQFEAAASRFLVNKELDGGINNSDAPENSNLVGFIFEGEDLTEEEFNKLLPEEKYEKVKKLTNILQGKTGFRNYAIEERVHEAKVPVENLLDDTKLTRIANVMHKVAFKPLLPNYNSMALAERYNEAVHGRATTVYSHPFEIPAFNADKHEEVQYKMAVKEKLMADYDTYLNKYLNL